MKIFSVKYLVITIGCFLTATTLWANGNTVGWLSLDMAKAQMNDVVMLASFFTNDVQTQLETDGTPLASIDELAPSFSSPFVDDLYITDGVITIDLAANGPLHPDLRSITITLTPNVVNSAIQNWTCTTSSALNITMMNNNYDLANVLNYPLSLCTS